MIPENPGHLCRVTKRRLPRRPRSLTGVRAPSAQSQPVTGTNVMGIHKNQQHVIFFIRIQVDEISSVAGGCKSCCFVVPHSASHPLQTTVKLEHGFRVCFCWCSFFPWFALGGRPWSNFLVSTLGHKDFQLER